MLDICEPFDCEPFDAEERLIINVGIAVGRISDGGPTSGAINEIANVRASSKRGIRVDDVYRDVPGLNGCSCGSSEGGRSVEEYRVQLTCKHKREGQIGRTTGCSTGASLSVRVMHTTIPDSLMPCSIECLRFNRVGETSPSLQSLPIFHPDEYVIFVVSASSTIMLFASSRVPANDKISAAVKES